MTELGFPSFSSFTYKWTHDVFLSFRGEDTRYGFTGNLYDALCKRGLRTVIDHREIRKGEYITPTLLRLIEESNSAIVVFSKEYASSTFCLTELAHIVDCMKRRNGRFIWPIFYNVDPSDVRHQKGSYEVAFDRYEGVEDESTVKRWRLALNEVANINGWHFHPRTAAKHDPVRDISPLKESWMLKVRVVRLWTMPGFNLPNEINSIEMVLCDKDDGRVSATIKKIFVQKFKNQLCEGKFYIISQFGVGHNSGRYKTTRHPFKINFQFSTKIVLCEEDPCISMYGCEFVPFGHICKKITDENFLVDVVGKLSGTSEVEEIIKDGNKIKRITIELEDMDKVKLTCTLWGKYADSLDSYMSGDRDGAVILVLQWCKIKEFSGDREISSSLYATRMLINPTLPEVLELRSSLESEDKYFLQKPYQISSQSSISMVNDLLQVTNRKTIDEILNCTMDTTCVTLATVLSVQLDRGWFYNSCKRCTKKVTPDGHAFFCEKCNKLVSEVVPRYKLELGVIDGTGSATFVVFDKEATQFLHCSASEMQNSVLMQNGDSNQTPDELNNFLGKKFLFKIRIKENSFGVAKSMYMVRRMSWDESLIESFQLPSSGYLNEPRSPGTTANDKASSSTCENDKEENIQDIVTQAKRSSSEILGEDALIGKDLIAQLSSNKMRKVI